MSQQFARSDDMASSPEHCGLKALNSKLLSQRRQEATVLQRLHGMRLEGINLHWYLRRQCDLSGRRVRKTS
jgi:hypothetical protein